MAAVISTALVFLKVEYRPRWGHIIPAIALMLCACSVMIEGYRWQMEGAYIVSVLVFVFSAKRLKNLKPDEPVAPVKDRKWLRMSGGIAGLIALAYTGLMCFLFPVFELPAPTGEYPIGTAYYSLTDSTRVDSLSDLPDAHREISLQVWYPAAPEQTGTPVPYMSEEAAAAFGAYLRLPGDDMLSYFSLVSTYSSTEFPLRPTDTAYRVILFSPSGLMNGTTALSEDLASHGYVVIAVGHPYWNPFVYDSTGGVVPFDAMNEHYAAMRRELGSGEVESIKDRILQTDDPAEQNELVRQLTDAQPLNTADIKRWADDISFVIDWLRPMNSPTGFFAGNLSLDHIGVMGFSKGGCAAGQVCVQDNRVKAGINFDGFMYGDVVDSPLTVPFLFMHSTPANDGGWISGGTFANADSTARQIRINGAAHTSFGDACLWGPGLTGAMNGGSIDGDRMIEITRAYTRAFLDRHLKRLADSLLDDPSDGYPEVEVRAK